VFFEPKTIPMPYFEGLGSAVMQVEEYLLSVFEDRMVPPARYVHNRTDAAGVVFTPNLV